jgi:hypothetical protein
MSIGPRVDRFGNVRPIGMTIDHHAIAAAPAQKLVQRHARHLGLDVPQRHVNRVARIVTGPRRQYAPR